MDAKSVSLYFKNGSSDKEYHATLEPKDDGFVVNFAYGRRTSPAMCCRR
jgi:bifunctional non-homologous end joining protein LigD